MPAKKLWRVPLKLSNDNLNTETVLLSQEATDIIMKKHGSGKVGAYESCMSS